MDTKNYMFSLEFLVRDYECDLQGVVNNACYQHYFEHTRHEFLKEKNLDFAQMHNDGIDAMVVRAEIEYKQPLKSGDQFIVGLSVEKKGRTRIVFLQDIYRLSDDKLMCTALFDTVCIEQGKPIKPDHIFSKMTAR